MNENEKRKEKEGNLPVATASFPFGTAFSRAKIIQVLILLREEKRTFYRIVGTERNHLYTKLVLERNVVSGYIIIICMNVVLQ